MTPRSRASRVAGSLFPALMLAMMTLWAGTFAAGATPAGAVTAQALLLGGALFGSGAWRDPLALGRRGRWLPPLMIASVAASLSLGPVPRAGIVGVLLLPAFLFLPAAVASCWRAKEDLRRGLGAVGAIFGVVAAISLGLWWEQASPRAAMPLGHHNLLATWLVVLWPIALVGLLTTSFRRRWLVLVAMLGTAALAGTGSFLAVGAFVAQSLGAAVWWRPARAWLVVALLVLVAGPSVVDRTVDWWMTSQSTQPKIGEEKLGEDPRATAGRRPEHSAPSPLQRVQQMFLGKDSSARARSVYLAAGWEGWQRRPLLGWGPGAVPFTIAESMRPMRGVNPPSEIIGDLHSLPLHLLCEIGALGLALAVVVTWTFIARRVRELRSSRFPLLLQAALLGLGGGGVMLIGNAPLSILALPSALAVVGGAALAASGPVHGGGRIPKAATVMLYLIPVAFVLVPFGRAHLLYQRASSSESAIDALADLRQAVDLDPGFPLYRARAAWLSVKLAGGGERSADEALGAARLAYRLAPFWLEAGVLGLETGRPWATAALETAFELDPLSPIAAFHLMRADPGEARAVALGVKAVEGNARLGRAVFWERYPVLRDAVGRELTGKGRRAAAVGPAPKGGRTALLVQSMDRRYALSLSLFAFRRSPWPADLAAVEVRLGD